MPRPERSIITPSYKYSGNKELAIKYSGIARAFLGYSNNIFGGNKSFHTSLELDDGTNIFVTKAVKHYVIRIDSPFFSVETAAVDLWQLLYHPAFSSKEDFEVIPEVTPSSGNPTMWVGDVDGAWGYKTLHEDPPGHLNSNVIGKEFQLIDFNPEYPALPSPGSLLITNAFVLNKPGMGALNRTLLSYNPAQLSFESLSETTPEDTVFLEGIGGDPTQNGKLAGNIDWRSDSGAIYSIDGPESRGIPYHINSRMTLGNTTAAYITGPGHAQQMDVRNGYWSTMPFGKNIFRGGESLGGGPTGKMITGVCVKSGIHPTTLVQGEFAIVTTIPDDNEDYYPVIELYYQQIISGEPLDSDDWELMSETGSESEIKGSDCVPVFFSSSANKGICTFPDFRLVPGETANPPSTFPARNVHTYSTLRIEIINISSFTWTMTEEPDAEFLPVSVDISRAANTTGDSEFTIPESSYKTRISSDFRYKTETEVYLSKEVTYARSDSDSNTYYEPGTSPEQYPHNSNSNLFVVLENHLVDITTKILVKIEYFISWVNETSGDVDNTLSDEDLGIEVPLVVSTGQEEEKSVLTVKYDQDFILDQKQYAIYLQSQDLNVTLQTADLVNFQVPPELTARVVPENVNIVSLSTSEVCCVSCDLRFSLTTFVIHGSSSTGPIGDVPPESAEYIYSVDKTLYKAPENSPSQDNYDTGIWRTVTKLISSGINRGRLFGSGFQNFTYSGGSGKLYNIGIRRDEGYLTGYTTAYSYLTLGLDANKDNYILKTPFLDHLPTYDYRPKDPPNPEEPDKLAESPHATEFKVPEFFPDKETHRNVSIYRGIVNASEPINAQTYPDTI